MYTAHIAKTTIRLTAIHQGEPQEGTFYKPSLVIGRVSHGGEEPDFDLSRDPNVSRSHARIRVEGQTCWIQDLGSRFGTSVDGEDIRGRGEVRVDAGSRIRIAETDLKVEGPFESASGFAELEPQASSATSFEIEKTIARSPERSGPRKSGVLGSRELQARILDVLVRFSVQAPLEVLLQTIIAGVVETIPGARRGTLLLRNPATDGLLLAAFVSTGEPSVSETLARRALKNCEAFVWQNRYGSDPSLSLQRHQTKSGMYAPLLSQGRAFGVLCVDSPDCNSAFPDEALELLVTIAYHAAVAVRAGIDQEVEISARSVAGGCTEQVRREDQKSALRSNCIRAVILLAHNQPLAA